MRTPLPKTIHCRYGGDQIKPMISVNQRLIHNVPVNEKLTQSQNVAFQILATVLPYQEAWDNHRMFVVKVMIPALQAAYPRHKEDLVDQDPIYALILAEDIREIAFNCDLSLLFPSDVICITEPMDNGDWSRVFHKVGVDSLVTLHNRKKFVQGQKFRLMIAKSPIPESTVDHHKGYRHCIEAWLTPDDMHAIWRGLNMIYGGPH